MAPKTKKPNPSETPKKEGKVKNRRQAQQLPQLPESNMEALGLDDEPSLIDVMNMPFLPPSLSPLKYGWMTSPHTWLTLEC